MKELPEMRQEMSNMSVFPQWGISALELGNTYEGFHEYFIHSIVMPKTRQEKTNKKIRQNKRKDYK